MSNQIDPTQVEALKNRFMIHDEVTLREMYKQFRQYYSSSGRASKETREMGMAYIAALEEKQKQRQWLEEEQERQRQQK